MHWLFSPEATLGSLFVATFLAATIVPLSSEVTLFAVLRLNTDLFWPAIGVATLGNTLGGLSSYAIGRLFAKEKPLRHVDRVRRHGAPVLVFAWLPLVGDALCVAAGWLKLNWASVVLWQAIGRFARYWLVANGALL